MRRPSGQWLGRSAHAIARLPAEYAIVLLLILLFPVSLLPVPYVALTPGPTVDTLGEFEGTPVLTITGAPTYPSEGELRFTTVGVYDHESLGEAVLAWFDGSQAVVPRSTVYPPGRSREETDAFNSQEFSESESSATAAALRYLGYPTEVVVVDVRTDGPAAGILLKDDVITTVDGKPVASSAAVIRNVSSVDPGTTVQVGYLRGGVPAVAAVVTEAAPGDPDKSVIGVTITEQAQGPVRVSVSAQDVGGPSAGLMLSVGMVDELTPEDLSDGRTVAGTGTITAEGRVGPIGGVQQKVVAAYDAGAREFLLPYANCSDAQGNAPDGLRLVPVRTLTDAIDVLKLGKAGVSSDKVPSCPAG